MTRRAGRARRRVVPGGRRGAARTAGAAAAHPDLGAQLTRRGPRERALRSDGACLYRIAPPAWEDVTPDDVLALRADAAARRGSADGFDIAVGGRARRGDEAAERAYIAALAQAGATWSHEYLEPATPFEAARAHIAGGPLR